MKSRLSYFKHVKVWVPWHFSKGRCPWSSLVETANFSADSFFKTLANNGIVIWVNTSWRGTIVVTMMIVMMWAMVRWRLPSWCDDCYNRICVDVQPTCSVHVRMKIMHFVVVIVINKVAWVFIDKWILRYCIQMLSLLLLPVMIAMWYFFMSPAIIINTDR